VRSMVALAHKRSAAEPIAHPDVQGAFGDSFLPVASRRRNLRNEMRAGWKLKQARKMIRERTPVTEVAQVHGVSRATLHRRMPELGRATDR